MSHPLRSSRPRLLAVALAAAALLAASGSDGSTKAADTGCADDDPSRRDHGRQRVDRLH